jgi:hypothetical protein
MPESFEEEYVTILRGRLGDERYDSINIRKQVTSSIDFFALEKEKRDSYFTDLFL